MTAVKERQTDGEKSPPWAETETEKTTGIKRKTSIGKNSTLHHDLTDIMVDYIPIIVQ